MRAQSLLVLFALLVQALCLPPTSPVKIFTSDLSITQFDGSVDKVTWSYDAVLRAEKIAFHRKGGFDTISFRYYSQATEYLVIQSAKGESCNAIPMSDSKMPSPSARAASFGEQAKLVQWQNVAEATSVDFELPASCHAVAPKSMGGLFCSACVTVGNQVIDLGCNATATEIANLCGNLFSSVCKQILDQACAGGCALEDCAQDACCLVDLCTGDICNGTSSSSSSSGSAAHVVAVPEPVKPAPAGIFCESCVSVGQQVINLGCNATADEIANLCGNVFASLCKSVLDTFCAGACKLEDCALQTCCLFDLCDGTQCNNSTSSSSTSAAHSPIRVW